MTRWLPAAILLALSGCATVSGEHVLTGTPGPAHDGAVKVVMEGAAEPVGYQEVGIVSATGVSTQATLVAVLGQLQAEAAKLGCDAVIHVRYDRGAESATGTGVAVWLQAEPAR